VAGEPTRSRRQSGPAGNAVALYDFESQGDDELTITEGERLEFIVDGSDVAPLCIIRSVHNELEALSLGDGEFVVTLRLEIVQGDDELTITEGERLEFIVDGSDDAEWSKVRRVNGSGEEGVVPASYIEIDAGADLSAALPPAATLHHPIRPQ
jgi:bifunctional DNA-binding transcriptional regulator/antitoxin component of YhaV-PrlF toxin-antitoxin module